MEKKVKRWTGRDHLGEFLKVDWRVEHGKVIELNWHWEREKKREIQRRYLGKTVLFTDQKQWESTAIVRTYRKLSRHEQLFRLSKGR